MLPLRQSGALVVALLLFGLAYLFSAREETVQRSTAEARSAEAAQMAANHTVEQLADVVNQAALEVASAKRLSQFEPLLKGAAADAQTIQDWLSNEAPWQAFRERGPTLLYLESQRIASTGALDLQGQVVAEAAAIAQEATRSTNPLARLRVFDDKLVSLAAAVIGQTANGRWGSLVLVREIPKSTLEQLARQSRPFVLIPNDSVTPEIGAAGGEDALNTLRTFLASGKTVSSCCAFAAVGAFRVLTAFDASTMLGDAEASIRKLRVRVFAFAALLAAVILAFGFFPRRTLQQSPSNTVSPAIDVPLGNTSPRFDNVLATDGALAASPFDRTTATKVGPAPTTRYRTVSALGEGGMAKVSVAEVLGAEGFRRLFVVKRLRAELIGNEEAVAQFIDEGRLGASLVHSNIVPVFDFGRDAEGYFIVQEYILGRSVDTLTRLSLSILGRPLSTPVVLYLAQEALKALSYAHTRTDDNGRPLSLVHRDVSPNNLMVSARGELKLLDFGIVKSEQRLTKTQTGMVKGNLYYMSPEQARAQPVDARSDLYSLGLVLFTAAMGGPAYQGTTSFELLNEAANGFGERALERVNDLSPPLAGLLRNALAFRPEQRFVNAEAFLTAVAASGPCATQSEMQALVQSLCGPDLADETQRLRGQPS